MAWAIQAPYLLSPSHKAHLAPWPQRAFAGGTRPPPLPASVLARQASKSGSGDGSGNAAAAAAAAAGAAGSGAAAAVAAGTDADADTAVARGAHSQAGSGVGRSESQPPRAVSVRTLEVRWLRTALVVVEQQLHCMALVRVGVQVWVWVWVLTWGLRYIA